MINPKSVIDKCTSYFCILKSVLKSSASPFPLCVDIDKSDVSVTYGDKWADGKSILGLLVLEVLTGTSIVVEIVGEDAEAAAAAIQELIEDGDGMFNTPLKNG